MGGKVSSPFDEAKYNALLEGLEVSVLKLSELADDSKGIRMDSEFYQKKFLSILKNNQLNLKPLGDFVKHGYRVVYENTKILKSEEAVENNYPVFLQATDVETPFIKTDNLFYVHENDWIRYEKGRVEKGELLIEVKGKIEKVAIVPNDFPNKVLVSGSLYKLTVNDKINKHYLLCYLISNYGQSFKDRYSSNLLIAFLSKFDLYKLPIPVFSKEFQDKIEELYLKAHEARKTSQNLYTTAEAELLAALGLSDYQPSTENVQVKSLKDSFLSSGRLDAEYYQPKYEYVVNVIQNYEGGFAKLKEFTKSYSTGYPFKSQSYSDEGFNLIRINNIKKGYLDIENAAKIPVKDTELSKRDIVKENDILLSMSGTIGNSCKIPKGVKAIINQRILKITPKNYDFDVLPLIINSIIGEYQLERIGTGGVQTNISGTDIFDILIPILDEDLQKQIGDNIRRSFQRKNQSKQLLHIAKTGVEKAIESSEAEAMAWMENEIVNLENL